MAKNSSFCKSCKFSVSCCLFQHFWAKYQTQAVGKLCDLHCASRVLLLSTAYAKFLHWSIEFFFLHCDFLFLYMTAEKGKGEKMGMGGDYEQSITNVTGDEPW